MDDSLLGTGIDLSGGIESCRVGDDLPEMLVIRSLQLVLDRTLEDMGLQVSGQTLVMLLVGAFVGLLYVGMMEVLARRRAQRAQPDRAALKELLGLICVFRPIVITDSAGT